jgi:large subunit ribosomal protein L25
MDEVMSSHITLAAQPRDESITTRALRRQQLVPGVVYGRDFTPRNVQFQYLPVERAIHRAGTSQLVALTIAGEQEQYLTLVRDVQHDPVTGRVTHVDLYRVVAGQTVRVAVPIIQVGDAPVLAGGANITQLVESIEVECLPADMPEHIVADMTKLVTVQDRITVADLNIPENVRVLSDMDLDVIQVSAAHDLEAELEAEAEAGEAGEAAAPEAAGGDEE